MSEGVSLGVVLAVYIIGFLIGLFAFFKTPNRVFGSARVFHILFGLFLPPVEIVLGTIELSMN